MSRLSRFLTLVMPSLHLILCISVEVTSDAGGWKWFLVGIIDYPASAWLKQISFLPQFITFAVFGTLWWFFISCLILFIFRLMFRIGKALENASTK